MHKEIPILFSAPMVQAILEGRKKMTRRICRDNGSDVEGFQYVSNNPTFPESWNGKLSDPYTGWVVKYDNLPLRLPRKCPYGKTGDILWVRESFNIEQYPVGPEGNHDEFLYYYKATEKVYKDMKWRPSIHMPKDAARIWLEVTDITVERLQDISGYDVVREGVGTLGSAARSMTSARIDYEHAQPGLIRQFKELWGKINGTESWEANPWVWVVSFKVLSKTGKPEFLTSETVLDHGKSKM